MSSLIINCVLLGLISYTFGQCTIRYTYKKVCIRYSYTSEDCQPWNTINCPKNTKTYHDFKCPVYICDKKLSEAKVREVLKERNLVKNERYETTPKPSTTTQRWFPTAPSSTTLVLTTSTKPSTTTQGPFPTARSSTTLVLTTSTTTRKPFARTVHSTKQNFPIAFTSTSARRQIFSSPAPTELKERLSTKYQTSTGSYSVGTLTKATTTTKNFGSTTSKPKIFKDESTQNFKVEETLENPNNYLPTWTLMPVTDTTTSSSTFNSTSSVHSRDSLLGRQLQSHEKNYADQTQRTEQRIDSIDLLYEKIVGSTQNTLSTTEIPKIAKKTSLDSIDELYQNIVKSENSELTFQTTTPSTTTTSSVTATKVSSQYDVTNSSDDLNDVKSSIDSRDLLDLKSNFNVKSERLQISKTETEKPRINDYPKSVVNLDLLYEKTILNTTLSPQRSNLTSEGSQSKELPRLQISAKVYKRNNPPPSQLTIDMKKRVAYRSAKSKVDCGSYECYQEYRMEANCIIYLETNNTQCHIPCFMTGCKTEIHHFQLCPVWTCDEKSTTSTSTTSTTTTTSTVTTTTATTTTTKRPPHPQPAHCKMSVWMYGSIILNILFFAIIAAVLIVKCRKFFYDRATNRSLDGNRFFSIGGGREEEESQQLLGNERQPNQGPEEEQQQQQQQQQEEVPQLQQQELHVPRLEQERWDDIGLANANHDSESQAVSLNNPTASNSETNKESVFLLMKALKKINPKK